MRPGRQLRDVLIKAALPLSVAAVIWVCTSGPRESGLDAVKESRAVGRLSASIPKADSESLAAAAHRDAGRTRDRFDEPDGAIEHYWLKRQGPTPEHDPVVAYRKALHRMDSMPRHSAALGALLPLRHQSRSPLSKLRPNRAVETWVPVGPGNIGGRTRTLLIHPAQPDIMYAGGVSGGVWKTTDGGVSWTPLADQIANIAVNSMAMDPADPETIYAGTGEGYFREIERGTWLPLRGAGIFKSDDGGATWSHLPNTDGEDFHWVNDLIISTGNSKRIYAATRTGVHLSEDGGLSWTQLLDPEVNGGCLDLALRTDRSVDWLFASCGTFAQATVYRKIMNQAAEWEAVLSEPGMGRTSLAIAPSDQSVVYAMAASNVPGTNGLYEKALHGVYRSTAGGAPGTWRTRVDNSDRHKLNTLLLTNAISSSYVECGEADQNYWTPMGWYCNEIAVDPTDPDVVWAGGVDLFRSDDGGRNWGLASYWWAGYDPLDPSWVHADQHAIVFHPDFDGADTTRMFSASDGGIYLTDNPYAAIGQDDAAICDATRSGVAFRNLNRGFGITQFYHGAPLPGGEGYLGGAQDNGTLIGLDEWGTDGWVRIAGGDGGYVAVDPQNPQNMYVESQRFGFRRSIDGGYTFQGATEGVDEPYQNFLFITPFVMDPNDPERLWVGGRRVWRTDNMAVSWQAASADPLGSGRVSALAVTPGNSEAVLIGTTDGFIYRTDSALDAGAATTWDASRPRDGFVSSITFDPGTAAVVYATFAGFGGRHVWRSEDHGVHWEALDGIGAGSLPDIPVHSIVVDPENSNRLYLGTDLGVFTSLNRGRSWAVENTGYANAVTEWLAIGTDNDGAYWLFAFTHGRGAWKVKLRPQQPPRRPGRRLSP